MSCSKLLNIVKLSSRHVGIEIWDPRARVVCNNFGKDLQIDEKKTCFDKC